MDGVLLIDKPSGPTSHDVVARLRRTTGERAIGHTGTLDPLASGLMVLVLGRATRLAPFLSSGDKSYEATIRLGVETDTDDSMGQTVRTAASPPPDDESIGAALAAFRGTFEQVPPAYSAKKVAGEKAYDRARRDQPVALRPIVVTVRALEFVDRQDDRLTIRVSATAGFYVRALARDLGRRLGCGGHLDRLRRTRSGWFDLTQALPLGDAERLGRELAARVIPPADALPGLPAVEVNQAGLTRVSHGNWLGPEHVRKGLSASAAAGAPLDCRDEDGAGGTPGRAGSPVRVLTDDGRLVAIAEARRGALHPVLVLG